INHKKSDRLPCSYEATSEVTEKLIKYLNIDKKGINTDKAVTGSNQPSSGQKEIKFGLEHEIELCKILGSDHSIVACPINPKNAIGSWWGLPLLKRRDDGKIIGAWDIVFQEWEYYYGTYIEIYSSPLVNATYDDIKKVRLPSMDLWDFEGYKDIISKYKDSFIWMNMNGCFDIARFQRGTENFLIDLVVEPKKAEVLLNKANELAIQFFENAIKKIKGQVDGIYCGDDFGTQNGLLISPEMWRKYIKPKYKELVSIIKSHGLKYCHHSCGGIRQIIPDMIEIGFDILNPIQPLAAGMNPEEIGKEYGKDIAFYGGIDEQRTLPNGSPDDVKNEVMHRIQTLGANDGYIVAPSHAFQPDTPIENILALYETVLGHSIS
ncbi:uroporphyrinogen decarboxylase family protein, partial [Actinomycetota bacterium]